MYKFCMPYSAFWRIKTYDDWFSKNNVVHKRDFTLKVKYMNGQTTVILKFARGEDAAAFSLKFGSEIGGQ